MSERMWRFFIDVGGTFTDVVARRPDGTLRTHKLLSSGVIRGVCDAGSTADRIMDARRVGEPDGLWRGYRLSLRSPDGRESLHTADVCGFDGASGRLTPATRLDAPPRAGASYELCSKEEAPIVAIRYLMGIGLYEPIGRCEVRLGTTRATNALLERKGARVAFVTTRGFADVLRIGYQDRPALFELNIRKPEPLASRVVELDQRMGPNGEVLRCLDEVDAARQLNEAFDDGFRAVAICLLHSYANAAHERCVATIAQRIGFSHVSVSSQVAHMQRIVPRGETTVADAYLSPVIERYVAALRRSLPDARLRLMTSAGGLVDAGSVSGKDTILSGPAGGVIGCRAVARRAGFRKTIGFDMGGTSTDVCRIDEPPHDLEYRQESQTAGVRLMTPMLAVESVAAGGGSICAFDGQKLTVGPHSAGAEPGPASYGHGGPLTVTDINVYLGRVVAEYFPFPLDQTAIERRLTELSDDVRRASGRDLAPAELADGFLRIANANMALAIKRISTAKGYDPREYVLTTFGGAGAQHACAVARALGVRRILCTPPAGVLSAVGIGVAPIKRIGQRSAHHVIGADFDDGQTLRTAIGPTFAAIRVELVQALSHDGVEESLLDPALCTIDVCYAGQSTLLSVPFDPVESVRERFEAQHQQLYGYRHPAREIEVRVARVELGAAPDDSALSPSDSGRRPPVFSPDEGGTITRSSGDAACEKTVQMLVDGATQPVPLYQRHALLPDHVLHGPAIVIEDTSTIVVDPGWEARVVPATNDIVLIDRQTKEHDEHLSTEVDPVRLELFNNQFAAIAEQMGVTLRRTALSVNVKERLDFSCALFTPEGDLVANAPHIPVHLGGMSDCVKALGEDIGTFAPGDVYITNDPFRGGSHLNDVTVITPVHDNRGAHILFFVASRAHHAEIGGRRPGSMPADSKCLAEEGVVLRAFRWMEDKSPRIEALRALLLRGPYPSRAPEENLADIAAQVAANQTGVRELTDLIARFGVSVVHGYMRHIQRAAEQKMRSALARLPNGVHSFADAMDDGTPIQVKVSIEHDRATIDFSGTGPVHPGNLNANRAIVASAVMYCFRCLIGEEIPLNAGVLAPLDIILPECILNPPFAEEPAQCPAVAGGNVETSQRIVDVLFGALNTLAASQGTMNNLLIGDDRFGYYETICGGAGAGPGFDGADAVHTHMTNTRLTDPEVLEARVPVRLVRFSLRHGSGGDGRYRGGCGVVREFEFLAPLEVSILSQRRTTAPYGLLGGSPGRPGRNRLRRAQTNDFEELPPIVRFRAERSDRLIIETPGGGGFGVAVDCGAPGGPDS